MPSADNLFVIAALRYAQAALSVLPLLPGDKTPYLKGGYKIASRDKTVLARWWTQRADANVGIATGATSGILVLDIDPRNGGSTSLTDLLREHGELPPTWKVRTGGGGEHYYFRLPKGVKVRSGVLAVGVDLKAEGGFVVAPPSIHPSGAPYEWECEPCIDELADAPAWLLARPDKLIKDGTPPRGDASATPLGRLFAELTMLGKQLDDGKFAVVCPWHAQHTTGKDLDSSTVIFPAAEPDGLGGFHCSHSHCARRTARDALRELKLLRSEVNSNGSWRSDLRVNKDGVPRATFRNICLILRNDSGYAGRLRFDELHGKVLLGDDELSDSSVSRIRVDIDERYDIRASDADTVKAVQMIAEHNRFHPVRAYLENLKWDGLPRMHTVVSNILRVRVNSTEELELLTTLLRRWFIGLVGRPMRPGLKVDTALILQGNQGTGKSTFFRTLADNWFNDTEMGLDKDGMMLLSGAWISEWAELENVTGRNTVSRVKAFLSSTEDRFRPPFGRTPITVKRSSVVVGTTNLDTFLHDPTGSRRFWVIPVGAIDVGQLREQRDQLLAEAVEMFRKGEPHWLLPEEEEHRRTFASQFADTDPWEDEVLAYAQKQQFVRISDILADVLTIETGRQDRRAERRVADILRRVGWTPEQRRVAGGGKPQRIWQPPKTGTDVAMGR